MSTDFSLVDVLRGWSDLWRYPLLAVAQENADFGNETLCDAVLEGLADPVSGPESAVRRLSAAGRFAAAESLIGDDHRLYELVEDARRPAVAERDRRVAVLSRRAERAGEDPKPPPAVAEANRQVMADSGAEGALLDAWESVITGAERLRRDEIGRLVSEADPPLPDTRRESIERCLELGEFGAAERLARATSATTETGGPGAAPRGRRWPWHRPVAEILAWYDDPALATPEFRARWLPPEEDTAARELLRAFKSVVEDPGRGSGEALVGALHHLLGAEEMPAPAEEMMGGVHGVVSGLIDARLPRLALPHNLPLWISTSDTPPPLNLLERPILWLATDKQPDAAPDGVAVWDAASVFQLAAPNEGDGPARVSARRIAALRMICAQLRLGDLLGDAPAVDLGPRLDLRRQLAWLLDLLGVRVHGAALDMLRHDSSDHPVALRCALAALLPDDARPAELTAEVIARWHGDPAELARFRTQVLNTLGPDIETRSVLYAALLLHRGHQLEHFTADDVEQLLRLHEPEESQESQEPQESHEEKGEKGENAEPASAGKHRRVRLPPSYGHVPRALEHALTPGLLSKGEERDTFHLEPGGLRDLLSGDEAHLESALREVFKGMRARRHTLAEIVQSRVTLEAIRHLAINQLDAFRNLVRQMAAHRAGVPPELDSLITNAISHFEKFEDYRREAELSATTDIAEPREFDLGVLLRELSGERGDRLVRVDLDEGQARELTVYASRRMVKIALQNLILNAVQAIAGHDASGGCVQLRLRAGEPAADGVRCAVVDVEDDGPGMPADVRAEIERGRPVSTREGRGRGLPDARSLVSYCDGTLEVMPDGSPLGGAHFRVRIPLADRPAGPPS